MSTSTMKCFRGFLLLCVLAGLNCSASGGLVQSGTQGDRDSLSLCFLSDTQEPPFLERLFLKYDRNAAARDSIFDKICELHPMAVIHLGDLVSVGSDNDSWREVDQFVGRLRGQGIEFSPVPGNHEYRHSSRRGISNFTFRYPYAKLTGYSKRYVNVAIVLFNSNIDELSEDEARGQLSWYRQTLMDYESDPSIDFVIVGCHHSPFTNSKIVSGSEEVRDYYLPEFYKSKKCKLFLGGHAHAFEHFRIKGKDFLVLGGGGGLQHPLRIGENAEYQDLFSNSLEKRMFHFLMVRAYGDTLAVELKMLKPDFERFESVPQLLFVCDRSQEANPGNNPDRL
jgi:hypothetical protein